MSTFAKAWIRKHESTAVDSPGDVGDSVGPGRFVLTRRSFNFVAAKRRSAMATEIRPDVYDVTTRQDDSGRRYRVFLFDAATPVLVDTGHAGTVETLFGELEDLGVAPERLLITHADPDHVGGVDAIVDRYGVELLAPAGAELGSDAIPDRRFEDGAEVGPFTAVHIPGHTPHHHAFVHRDRPIAVMGDAVFGSDLRGLPAGYFVLPPGVYTADLDRAEASLEDLLGYEFETALVYHGSSVTADAHAKLETFVNFPGKP